MVTVPEELDGLQAELSVYSKAAAGTKHGSRIGTWWLERVSGIRSERARSGLREEKARLYWIGPATFEEKTRQ